MGCLLWPMMLPSVPGYDHSGLEVVEGRLIAGGA